LIASVGIAVTVRTIVVTIQLIPGVVKIVVASVIKRVVVGLVVVKMCFDPISVDLLRSLGLHSLGGVVLLLDLHLLRRQSQAQTLLPALQLPVLPSFQTILPALQLLKVGDVVLHRVGGGVGGSAAESSRQQQEER